MTQMVDISGQRFGALVALHPHDRDANGRFRWLCRCDCGKVLAIRSGNLRTGNSRSCGCQKKNASSRRCISLVGRVFGRLLVIRRDRTKKDKTYWICNCDCGVVRSVWSAHLLNGHTRSCGCLLSEKSREIAYKHLAGKQGPDHPRWDTELSDDDRRSRRSQEDKDWAAMILARSNFRCELCGATGRLNAHHIKGFAAYSDTRTKLFNGIALCVDCHTRFHKSRGYSDFSEDDFYTHFQLPNPGSVAGLRLPFDGDLGNVVKYVARAAHKGRELEDLKKAAWYLARKIGALEGETEKQNAPPAPVLPVDEIENPG